MATTKLMTAEELLALPDDGQRHELIDGELRTMGPTGDEHGGIVVALTISLGTHVRARQLGRVRAGEPGFRLRRNPDTVRAPDVAFIRREHLRAAGRVVGYREGAPDLAVEVRSPTDRTADVLKKVAEYLEAGARLVWVLDPDRRSAVVYRADGTVAVFGEDGVLDGEDVLPGFLLALAEVWV